MAKVKNIRVESGSLSDKVTAELDGGLFVRLEITETGIKIITDLYDKYMYISPVSNNQAIIYFEPHKGDIY